MVGPCLPTIQPGAFNIIFKDVYFSFKLNSNCSVLPQRHKFSAHSVYFNNHSAILAELHHEHKITGEFRKNRFFEFQLGEL